MSVVVEAGGGGGRTQEYRRQGTGDWTGHRTPGGRNVRAGKAAGNGPVREKYGRGWTPGQRQKLRDVEHTFRVEPEVADEFQAKNGKVRR